MKWLLIGFIKFWRAVISPSYGAVCKYYPSCSAYGLEAVETHGAIKGGGLTIWRIMRCNPWSHGGYDPVPGTEAARLWELEQAGLWGPEAEAASRARVADGRASDARATAPAIGVSAIGVGA